MLAAGGTGGHMYPAAELARVLLKRGHEVNLLTDKRGMHFAHIFGDIHKRVVTSGSFSRGTIFGKIFALIGLAIGSAKARNIFKKRSPKLVVGFGGYSSLPGILASKTMDIPYCLHEQNLVLGKVNRKVLAGVSKLGISAKSTLLVPLSLGSKIVVTGNPIRPEIIKVGKEKFNPPRQGKAFRINVLQQCRPSEVETIGEAFKTAGVKAKTTSFIDDMAKALKDSHLVICRSGAGAVFETMAARRPSILVPLLTSADGHQMENAKMVVRVGGGWLCIENQNIDMSLKKLIEGLIKKPEDLLKAANAARAASIFDASKLLADMVEDALKDKESFA